MWCCSVVAGLLFPFRRVSRPVCRCWVLWTGATSLNNTPLTPVQSVQQQSPSAHRELEQDLQNKHITSWQAKCCLTINDNFIAPFKIKWTALLSIAYVGKGLLRRILTETKLYWQAHRGDVPSKSTSDSNRFAMLSFTLSYTSPSISFEHFTMLKYILQENVWFETVLIGSNSSSVAHYFY